MIGSDNIGSKIIKFLNNMSLYSRIKETALIEQVVRLNGEI